MSFADSFKKLNELDMGELDLENVGSWPLPVRIIACILTLVLVLFMGYQFHISHQQNMLSKAMAKEVELKEQFRMKAVQSANLAAYRAQMADMEASFEALVNQLPSDTEVPGLLEDISFTGRSAGLQFDAIKLQPEKEMEFYVELPISIVVSGDYHGLGSFVSGVASLSRIVTLHDFSITPSNGKQNLKMEILARTYRYNDKESE